MTTCLMREQESCSDDRHEKYAELIRLHKGGLNARAIGTLLGLTRNAVIGRLYRLGLGSCSYSGPTTMERLKALHDSMNALLEDCADLEAAGVLTIRTEQSRSPL